MASKKAPTATKIGFARLPKAKREAISALGGKAAAKPAKSAKRK